MIQISNKTAFLRSFLTVASISKVTKSDLRPLVVRTGHIITIYSRHTGSCGLIAVDCLALLRLEPDQSANCSRTSPVEKKQKTKNARYLAVTGSRTQNRFSDPSPLPPPSATSTTNTTPTTHHCPGVVLWRTNKVVNTMRTGLGCRVD